MRRLVGVVAVLAVVAAGIGLWPAREPAPRSADPENARASALEERTATADAPLAGHAGDAGPTLRRRPRSLRGTRGDGELTTDDAGHLVVTTAARRFFDYFLTATGEESPADLRARIVAAIERRLSPAAAAEATDLLDRYLAYRERVRDLAGHADTGDPRARLEAVAAIRRDTFGAAVAEALFADEEAAARVAIAEQEVATNPSLSPEERVRQLAALDAQLPEALREARAATLAAVTLRNEEAALRERGGTPEDVHALREQLVGPDAAARLAALDQRRAEWAGRLDAYRAARAALEADPALDATQRAAAVERLLAERFDATERQRVRALDELSDAGGVAATPR